MDYTRADYDQAVNVIQGRTRHKPVIGLVLGSGLGELADSIEEADIIPYEEIPGWPVSTVHGHHGRLVIGKLADKTVIVQQGRAHFYEGYTLQQATFPIRVMHYLGVHTLFLTNAAGGVNPAYRAGELMLLNDHINFVGMAGFNPLSGPNDDTLGPRFLGMTHTYDKALRQIALQVAQSANITLHEGTYVCLSGPNFETPAEIRMLRVLGGDAVGMSTVHEVLVARHAGMRVLACSSITNEGIDTLDSLKDTNHEEVLEMGKVIVPQLTTILKGVLQAITV